MNIHRIHDWYMVVTHSLFHLHTHVWRSAVKQKQSREWKYGTVQSGGDQTRIEVGPIFLLNKSKQIDIRGVNLTAICLEGKTKGK